MEKALTIVRRQFTNEREIVTDNLCEPRGSVRLAGNGYF